MFYIVQLVDNSRCIIDAENESAAHSQCDATFGKDGWVTMVPANDTELDDFEIEELEEKREEAVDYLSTMIKSYMLYSKLDAGTIVGIIEDIADSILEDKLNEG